MNNKAIFLVGGPGSGKDIILKDIVNNYGIKEFTIEQVESVFNNPISENDKKYSIMKKEGIIISTNAYKFNNIEQVKGLLENFGYSSAMIFVDVSDSVSKTRISKRNFSEESRREKLTISKHNIPFFNELFESFILYDNSSILEDSGQLNSIKQFCNRFLNGDFLKIFENHDKKINKKFSIKKKLLGVVPGPLSKIPTDSISQGLDTRNSGIGYSSTSTVGPMYSETYATDIDVNRPMFTSPERGNERAEYPTEPVKVDSKKVKIIKKLAKQKYSKEIQWDH